jgi:hypothetical protein
MDYLVAFTFKSSYNLYDEGPEKENYLNKEFPRALNGQLIHDCGVYALRAAYIFSLIRQEQDLLFRFVYLPAHVGLVVLQRSVIIEGKKKYAPFFILHNNFIKHIGDLIEVAKIRHDWEAFKEPATPGAAPKPLPTDDLQFQGELAAFLFIYGPVDMPFRLKEVPDDSKLTPAALKSKLWDFYKKEAEFDIFGDEAGDTKSEVFQTHLKYLELTDDFKNLWNKIIYFWNDLAIQWKVLNESVQHEAPQGKLLSDKAVPLLQRYHDWLIQVRQSSFAPIVAGFNNLDEKKKELSALVQAHPKLKKAGVLFSHGQRAEDTFRDLYIFSDVFEVFEETDKAKKEFGFDFYLKKVNDNLTTLKKQHQEVLINPILKLLTPAFATELDPLD